MPDLSVCARWLLGGGVEEGVHDDPRSACGLMTVRGEGTGRCTWGVGTHMKSSVAGVLPSCTYILVACCLLGTPESLVIACSSSFIASTISANLAFSFILLQTKKITFTRTHNDNNTSCNCTVWRLASCTGGTWLPGWMRSQYRCTS